ncbi:MAG: bifunctional oligoribonuclease/PAP phosphatase NrnA [Bacteroidales bacterium]|nr:bifunctional oligoribonuclease/PAP phosphatase NrnA [Bacteroidales bacterium]
MKQDYQLIKDAIDQHTNIVITTHVNPDGDAIGSSLGLYHYLIAKGKHVKVVVPNKIPDFLNWMDGIDQILRHDENVEKSKIAIEQAEIIFSLDYNALSRINHMEEELRKSTAIRILIDHHPEPELNDFKYSIATTVTSSTSELIYTYLCETKQLDFINKSIAEALYTGIMTDTGSFSYACNYKQTFLAVAEMIGKGLDIEKVQRKLFSNNREERLRLTGYSLNQKMVVLPEFKTAYIALTQKELKQFNFKPGDTEGLVNYGLSIKGVNMAVLLTEKENLVRLSFRSNGAIDVNQLCRKYFNGGGHIKAAGGNSSENMQQTISKLVSILPLLKDQLDTDVD